MDPAVELGLPAARRKLVVLCAGNKLTACMEPHKRDSRAGNQISHPAFFKP